MSNGTNANRRQRRQAQRQQKTIPQKEQVAIPASSIVPTHLHFGLTQHFDITFSEPYPDDKGDEFEDFHEQMRRMFHVIVSHPKILHAVCELEVLSAMESTYVDETYGDMNHHLGNTLERFLDCFIEEDQEYIRDNKSDYDAFSILWDCFESKPSGFGVDEYDLVCQDCGHHQ